MIRPCGWILVISLLVFLTAGGECIVGDVCCVEDWVPFIDPVLKAYKNHASDLKSQAFKDAIATWMADRDKLSAAELEDICGGHMGEKCEGTKDEATCICNKETGHVAEGTKCVAEKVDDPCIPDPNPDPCKQGMHCEGEPIGECKPGVGNPEMTGSGRISTDAGSGSGSYTPRPLMWVIIGGLTLIPAASSKFNSFST